MSSGAALVRSFGLAVRQLREARQWSQEELAEHSDLNRSFVGEIERGAATPSLITVAKLARALGLPASALIHRGEHLGAGRQLRVKNWMAIDG
ncbi:MAG: helix-turn-helix domain-containing protein [Gammaproteobacteria bacterium]